jgi:hypothetical protein
MKTKISIALLSCWAFACGASTEKSEDGPSADTKADHVGDDVASVCEQSGGTWDELSCGHYSCGEAPNCRAIIPGCDCGPGNNFVDDLGCVVDPACDGGEPSPTDLCQQSGGTWDELSCGHYSCGDPPDCRGIIPGCDCGVGSNYIEGVGCVEDDSCPQPISPATLCQDTGGAWDEGSCGHYTCGMAPLCEALIPGCDCGDGRTFVDGDGCQPDAGC